MSSPIFIEDEVASSSSTVAVTTGLGLGISPPPSEFLQQKRCGGRQAIIKPPSWGPLPRKPSSAPFSHHRSPSWVLPDDIDDVRQKANGNSVDSQLLNENDNNKQNQQCQTATITRKLDSKNMHESSSSSAFIFPSTTTAKKESEAEKRQKELRKLSKQLFSSGLDSEDQSPLSSSFNLTTTNTDFDEYNGTPAKVRGRSSDSFTSTLSLRSIDEKQQEQENRGNKNDKRVERQYRHQNQSFESEKVDGLFKQDYSMKKSSSSSSTISSSASSSYSQDQDTLKPHKSNMRPRRPLHPIFAPVAPDVSISIKKPHSRVPSSSSSIRSLQGSMETKRAYNDEELSTTEKTDGYRSFHESGLHSSSITEDEIKLSSNSNGEGVSSSQNDTYRSSSSSQHQTATNDPINYTLALLMAEEGRDIRIESNGRSLTEIEHLITSKTTHLILSNLTKEDSTAESEKVLQQEILERILGICSNSLLVLDIANMELEELPQALTQCSRLEELNLSGNHFLHSWNSGIDSQTRFCSSLQVLLIDKCGLTMLPGILMHFNQLKSLSARGNHLTHLPSWLHHLRNLERISVGENPFIGPWIDICLPFTFTSLRDCSRSSNHTRSSSSTSTSGGKTEEFNGKIGNRPRNRTLSNALLPIRSSSRQGRLVKSQQQKSNDEEELEELEDDRNMSNTVGSDQNSFDDGYCSSASPYLATNAKIRPNMTMSASDLRSLSDEVPSLSHSASSSPISDRSPSTPSSALSLSSPPPQTTNRKSSTGDSDSGRWAMFRRKLGRKSSSAVLDDTVSMVETNNNHHQKTMSTVLPNVVSSEMTSVAPVLAHTITKKKSFNPRSRPQTAGSVMPSERSSSLNDSNGSSIFTKFSTFDRNTTKKDSEEVIVSTMTAIEKNNVMLGSTVAREKRFRRTSFLPFAIPIDPSNNNNEEDNNVATDLHQRKNVKILLQYLEDLSQLNPAQRILNEFLTRPRMFSICSENSSLMPELARSGSENTMTTNSGGSSSRPSTDDESAGSGGASPSTSVGECVGGIHNSKLNSIMDVSTTPQIKDDAIRRANIITEIITTEETYVKGLRELIDIYVLPSSKSSDSSNQQPFIPIAERRLVFVNVEAILHFHKEAFLPSLRSAAQPLLDRKGVKPDVGDQEAMEEYNLMTVNVAERVAQTFERHIAFFRMYTAYVNNVENGQNRVAFWLTGPNASGPALRSGQSMSNLRRESASMKNNAENNSNFNHHHSASMSIRTSTAGGGSGGDSSSLTLGVKDRKRIKAFLQKARLDSRHSQLSLEAYLHLPVQRIPRYKLLISELARFCPLERLNDPHSITNALESVISIATMMNESKRQSEMDRRLLKWQEKIIGTFPSPLVQPHRRLIKDGGLILTRIVTRIPSFTAGRLTILGDSSMDDPMEEKLHLQIADAERLQQNSVSFGKPSPPPQQHQQVAHQRQGSSQSSDYSLPPPLPPKDNEEELLQVHHLEQRFVSTNVQVILCSDVTVILESTQSGGNDNNNLELFSVMRIESEPKIINDNQNNQNTLRICDSEKVYYLQAKNKQDAENWLKSFSIANSRRPSFCS